MFNRPQKSLRVTFDDYTIPAGGSIVDSDKSFDANQFMSEDNWVLNTSLLDMLVSWETEAVLLPDGTIYGDAQ
jgi:hypothetical protein